VMATALQLLGDAKGKDGSTKKKTSQRDGEEK